MVNQIVEKTNQITSKSTLGVEVCADSIYTDVNALQTCENIVFTYKCKPTLHR